MKLGTQLCLTGSLLICLAGAQDITKPVLREGIHVEMPVSGQPFEIRAADELNATVVAITADERVFLGVNRAEPAALGNLKAETVYVKADSRAPFQTVLAVLDALRGKSVVLLTAPPKEVERTGVLPPYGIRMLLAR